MTSATAEPTVTRFSIGIETEIGWHYLGGSFPRRRVLTYYRDGLKVINAWNVAGSFHSNSTDVAGFLAHCDTPDDPDDGNCRDHNAFAAALKSAIKRLDDNG